MAKQLGALLVNKGLITPQQLDEALAAQKIFGGRLGTCLVEMDFLDSEVLGANLGEQLNFPVATLEELQSVSAHALSLIPADMAGRLSALPLSQGGRRLKVAMVNPQDYGACEALGFSTGLRIVPCLAPEARLAFFLEQHYGITQSVRYIRLAPERTRGPALDAQNR